MHNTIIQLFDKVICFYLIFLLKKLESGLKLFANFKDIAGLITVPKQKQPFP